MPTVHALAVAATTAGTPRASASVNYQGTSNTTVTVLLVCPTWASADPAQNVTIDVQQSFDNGGTWESFATLLTQGGRLSRTGLMPQMQCQVVDGLGARKARVVFSVDTGSLAAGVDVTT